MTDGHARVYLHCMEFSFADDLRLENGRILLRPLTLEDIPGLLPPAMADPTLLQYSPLPIHSEDLLTTYVRGALEDRARGIRYPLVAIDKSAAGGARHAGCTSFAGVSNEDKRLEIGWTWYSPEFHRTGLNRNGKFLMLQYAFEVLSFERVEFRADSLNQRSRTAMERLGARYEGCLRSYRYRQDGTRRDNVYYSILKGEWPEVKANFPLR